jgi:hypothetical protein
MPYGRSYLNDGDDAPIVRFTFARHVFGFSSKRVVVARQTFRGGTVECLTEPCYHRRFRADQTGDNGGYALPTLARRCLDIAKWMVPAPDAGRTGEHGCLHGFRPGQGDDGTVANLTCDAPSQLAQESSACVAFNIRKAARAVTQLSDERMRPFGLRSTQLPILGMTLI